MPRYNPNTGVEYEGKFQNPLKDADYMGMLTGQALPGFILAGFGCLLAIVSVMLTLAVAVTKCFGICFDSCNSIFKPKPFMRKQLQTTKVVILIFSILSLCGFSLMISQGMMMRNRTNLMDIARTSLQDMHNATIKIETTLVKDEVKDAAYLEYSEFVKELNEDMAAIDEVFESTTDFIDNNKKNYTRYCFNLCGWDVCKRITIRVFRLQRSVEVVDNFNYFNVIIYDSIFCFVGIDYYGWHIFE